MVTTISNRRGNKYLIQNVQWNPDLSIGLNMQHCSVKGRQIGMCLYYVKKQYIPEKKQFSSLKRGFHTEHLEAEASMIPVTINNAIANP